MITKNKKERGAFLTAMIVIHIVGIVFSFKLFFIDIVVLKTSLDTAKSILLGSLFINIFSIYGIWKWRKWGVNLYIAIYTINLIYQFAVLSEPIQLLGILLGAFGASIYFWAIFRKWSYFE